MTTWSIRIGVLLLPGVCAAGLVGAPAMGQVSAANTIAPENTVVNAAKATAPPKPAGTPASTAVPKKKVRSTTTTTSLAAVEGGVPAAVAVSTPLAVATPVSSPVEAQSFSDPLADLASAALTAIPEGSVAGMVSAGTGLVNGQVPIVVGPAPAVQFAFTPATVPPDPNVPRRPPSDGVSSVVINTSDLGEYVLGTAIVAPISQESQKILAALPTATAERYIALLGAMARVVGPRTKTDPAALEAVWIRTDGRRMKAILTAMAQVGTRYRFTGNKPGGFDCSGLTSYAWSQAGVKIPRTSTLQYQGLAKKSASELLPGDIVWHPGHVSMYLGVGTAVVDAPQTGKTVLVKSASANSWVSFHSPL